jgi:tetratricopeptide (TPR) repeat protein
MIAQMTAAEIQKTYAEGLAAQNAGKLDAALKIFNRIVAGNPTIAEAHFQIGRILTQTDRFDLALTHLFTALQLRPGESAVWMALAEAVALGGTAETEARLLRMLKAPQVPIQTRILLQDRFGPRRASTRPATGGIGVADIRKLVGLMQAHRHADAERLATGLLKKHPKSALALNVLATAQAAQGKSQEAEQSFRRTLKADPRYAEAYDNLGGFYLELNREDEAAENFRRAVILAPGLPTGLMNLASAFTRTGHPDAALVLLDRALAGGTKTAPCYMAIGNAHTRLRNFSKAEAAFAQALAVLGNPSAKALGLMAQAQARLGKDEEAMQNFDRALEIDPNSAVATGGKASLLQTLGDFDQASVLFRRGFELDPYNGENYRSFIVSHKTQADDPVVPMMLARFDDPAMPEVDRMNLAFAIAKALEDIKDYPRSFAYLDKANALMRKIAPYQIEQRVQQVEKTKEAFDGFDWEGATVSGTSDFAPIFITGMPRSGTTLIEQIVASHSSVTGAGEVGECARAAQQLLTDGRSPRHMASLGNDEIVSLGKDFETFIREKFPQCDRITDKSIQTYMYLGLIKLALPKSRFIIVRRDPRDNLLSMYKNKFPDDTHLYAYDQQDLATFYGTFLDMIDFWRERVPGWFYEVQYEALVANPEEETRKLIDACGLEWEDACLKPQDNVRKVETLSVFQARQPISGGSVKGWKRYEKELAPMLKTLRENGLVAD